MSNHLFFKGRVVARSLRDGEVADPLRPRINPDDLTSQEKLDLVKKIEAGEIQAILFYSNSYRDVRNANDWRINASELDYFASTAAGSPLVVNHRRGVEDVCGTVLGAEMDGVEMITDHEITKPSEMIAFVRGERREFSVEADADRLACSKCFTTLGSFGGNRRWSWFDCAHGDETDTEIIAIGNPYLVHDSFVTDPAAQGTQVLTLSKIQEFIEGGDATPEEIERFRKIKSARKEGAPTMPAEKTDAEIIAQLRKDNAALEKSKTDAAALAATKAEESKLALKTSEDARFKIAFNKAVASKVAAESERAVLKEVYEALGLSKIESMLAARTPNAAASVATPTTPVGHGASEYDKDENIPAETSASTEGEFNPYAEYERRVKAGTMGQPQLDRIKGKARRPDSRLVKSLKKKGLG